MKALVTGHAGYIGGVLAQQLTADGHEVVGFDRSVKPADDVRERERVQSVISETAPDVVYHLAAEADVWEDDWQYLVDTNVTGTLNVVAGARESGVPVVFASSVAATGEFNRYGRSKRIAEQTISEYDGVTTLRFPNVVGLGAPRGQAQEMIQEGLDGEIEVWGDGEIVRSYVDVEDLCVCLREIATGSYVVDSPTAVAAHTTTNQKLGKLIQSVVEEETGSRPALTLVDRSPPSPDRLTGQGLQIREPTALEESVRSQVRATLEA